MSDLRIRNCPECNKELKYTNKFVYYRAKKKNSLCQSCAAKKRDNSQNFNIFNNDVKNGLKPVPFKGKKHTENSKEKISHKQKLNSHIYKTEEFKNKMSKITKGKNNPMYGKTFYSIWLEKYGKEEADKKLIEYKKKQSINSGGENNPMYGKPSPQGSGNGWKGWYKNVFFRSLLELSFLVNYIERFNMTFENGEKSKFKIQYLDFNNTTKNYFPDFIIDNKYMVEIKPKSLHNSKTIKLKTKYAIEYCNNNNLKYKLIEPIKIELEQILSLIDSGNLIFMEKYNEKLMKYKK